MEGIYDFVFPLYLQIGEEYYKLETADGSTAPIIRVNVNGPLSLHAEYAAAPRPVTRVPAAAVALAIGVVGLIYAR